MCVTCAGAPGAALRPLAAQTVSAREDGDAAEAAGFGDRRSERAVGAVRVCAAPRTRLQALHVAVGAALATAGRPAGAFPVTPAGGTRTHTELCENRQRHSQTLILEVHTHIHTHEHADPNSVARRKVLTINTNLNIKDTHYKDTEYRPGLHRTAKSTTPAFNTTAWSGGMVYTAAHAVMHEDFLV